MLDIPERVIRLCQRKMADSVIRKIRDTNPITLSSDDELVVVSQVHHKAIDMAILALKSFMSNLGMGRLEVVNDGSLTEDDLQQLNYHFPGITIVDIGSIELGQCPAGGTWERLIHVINLSQQSYVIQVDSDTLTVGPINEVYQSVLDNKAFLVGEPSWQQPIPVNYMSRYASQVDSSHVQVLSEQKLNTLNSIPITAYARGCSAFTGFPKGVLSFKDLESFSVEMEQLLGAKKWREWGSEQLSSNVMLSLCPDVCVMPWPKYLNFGFPFKNGRNDSLDSYANQTSLFHFIGTHRYSKGVYRKLARSVINKLS